MPRADAEGMGLKDGRVMAAGGNTAITTPATRTNTAEIYDPETGQWRLTGGTLSDPKVDHAIALLKDGRVLLAGGIRTNETYTASADVYDPRSDTWTPAPSMSRARGGIFAVTLKDGRVLVVGGLNNDPGTFPTNALASAEIFVPARRHGHGEDGDGRHGAGEHATGAFRSGAFAGISFLPAAAISFAGDTGEHNPGVRLTVPGSLPTGDTFSELDFLGAILTPANLTNAGVPAVGLSGDASRTSHDQAPGGDVFTSALDNNAPGDRVDLGASL